MSDRANTVSRIHLVYVVKHFAFKNIVFAVCNNEDNFFHAALAEFFCRRYERSAIAANIVADYNFFGSVNKVQKFVTFNTTFGVAVLITDDKWIVLLF